MSADVTLAGCEHRKPSRKDAGGFWGKRGQVWDDYRVSIHVINPVIFAQHFILMLWVSRVLFCPQWGGRAIEKPVLLVGGGRVPASTAHRQWSQEMQSQRAVPSGHALCGGRSVNLSRTNSKLPVMMMTHLARIHHSCTDPLIMHHGAMSLAVFGGNGPSTWFSSSLHDPSHDPACVAKAPNCYFCRTHEPACTQL